MTGDHATDAQLAERARAGDEAAFTSLYHRWQAGIYRYSLRMSGSAPAAEDITQEVFLALMNGCSRFDPALGSFSSYIYGVARNHVLRRLRKERVFESIPADEEAPDRGMHAAPAPPFEALCRLERQQMVDLLYRSIGGLPLRYREAVVLCELQEMNYADAARVIGCPEGTVRSRLHRARILLMEKLRQTIGEEMRPPGNESVRCLP